ncbi:hypothetical protein ACJZ2D_015328 [Fusarium nematophilum]
MSTRETLANFQDIRIKIGEYDQQFKKIKSPQTVYDEKASAIRSRISQAWAQLASAPVSSVPTLQDEIVTLGGQLKELEIDHKAGLEVEEKKYQERLEDTMGALYRDLISVMEPHRVESTLRALSNRETSQRGGDVTTDSTELRQSSFGTGSTSKDTNGQMNKRKIDLPVLPDDLEPPKRRKGGRSRRSEQLANQIPREKNAPKSSSEPPARGETRRSHRRHRDEKPTQEQDFEGITDPDPGKVYLAFWGKSKEWLAVLVLPMQDLEEAGVSGTIETLRLAEIMPLCYEYDKPTKRYVWREGYNEGQDLVTEREFPVMYFDGQDFPTKSAVGWVAARDLRGFDIKDSNKLVPHVRSVREFLKTRTAEMRLEEEESNEPDESVMVSQDDAEDEPLPAPPPQTHQTQQPEINPALSEEAHRELSPEKSQNEERVEQVTAVETSTRHSSPRLPGISVEPAAVPNSLPQTQPHPKPEPNIEIISIPSPGPDEQPTEAVNPVEPEIPMLPSRVRLEPQHQPNATEQESHTGIENVEHQPQGTSLVPSEASMLAQAALAGVRSPCPADSMLERRPSAASNWNRESPIFGQHHIEAVVSSLVARSDPSQPFRVQDIGSGAFRYPDAEKVAHLPAMGQSSEGASQSQRTEVDHGIAAMRESLDQPDVPAARPTDPVDAALSAMQAALDVDSRRRSVPNPTLPQSHPSLPPVQLSSSNFTAPSSSFGALMPPLSLPPISSVMEYDPAFQTPPILQDGNPGNANCASRGDNYLNTRRTPSLTDSSQLTFNADSRQITFNAPETPASRVVGIAPASAAWPYGLPVRLIAYLEDYLRRRHLPPGMNGLKDYSGKYKCPLCTEKRKRPKGWVSLASFGGHLAQHWPDLEKALSSPQ